MFNHDSYLCLNSIICISVVSAFYRITFIIFILSCNILWPHFRHFNFYLSLFSILSIFQKIFSFTFSCFNALTTLYPPVGVLILISRAIQIFFRFSSCYLLHEGGCYSPPASKCQRKNYLFSISFYLVLYLCFHGSFCRFWKQQIRHQDTLIIVFSIALF